MLIDKVYEKNKKIWHEKNPGFELHHIYGRRGISKCCLRFFHIADHGHQNDWEYVGNLRKTYRTEYLLVQKLYMKNEGCMKELFECCKYCKMPKLMEVGNE